MHPNNPDEGIPIDQLQAGDLITYLEGICEATENQGTPVQISLDSRIVRKLLLHIARGNDTIAGLVAYSCRDGSELNSFGISDLAAGIQWLVAEEIVQLKVDAGRLLVAEWAQQ